MSTSPCYKCVDRHIGCHGVCERYKAYSDAEADKKNLIKAKKAEDKIYVDYINETFIHNKWGEVKHRKMKGK